MLIVGCGQRVRTLDEREREGEGDTAESSAEAATGACIGALVSASELGWRLGSTRATQAHLRADGRALGEEEDTGSPRQKVLAG